MMREVAHAQKRNLSSDLHINQSISQFICQLITFTK